MHLTDADRASLERVLAVLDAEAIVRRGSVLELAYVELAEELRSVRGDVPQTADAS